MQLSSTQKLGLSLSPDRDSQYFLITGGGTSDYLTVITVFMSRFS